MKKILLMAMAILASVQINAAEYAIVDSFTTPD